MEKLNQLTKATCFNGSQYVFSHFSESNQCVMQFGIFLPPQIISQTCPVIYWLSGLTCTEQNVITKSGIQRIAAELGIVIVAPDTSPRGENIPDADQSNLGQGAGFYLNATSAPWCDYYQMETYLTSELPPLIANHFSIDNQRVSIMGHSMGGHGAIALAIKYPARYRSVSAFAPIASLSKSPWGKEALSHYLGHDQKNWHVHDLTWLIKNRGWQGPAILIDQGTDDPFIDEQLQPNLLTDACAEKGINHTFRWQDGYDHSYFFIATFIEDHLRYHAQFLH